MLSATGAGGGVESRGGEGGGQGEEFASYTLTSVCQEVFYSQTEQLGHRELGGFGEEERWC